MRLFIVLACLYALASANPLPILKSKSLHSIKERMFGVNTDCIQCGVHTVQQIPAMPPVPQVYIETSYNPSLQMHGVSVASSNAHAQSAAAQAGQTTHMFNTNGLGSQQFVQQTGPATLNYNQQVQNIAEATSAVNTQSSYSSGTNLWQHANAANSGHQQFSVVQGGRPAVFGPPPATVANSWSEGAQYNSYSPTAYAGEVFDNSAAAAAAAAASASSSASSWGQNNGNFGLNRGNVGGGAFSQSSSSSWSSSHSG